MITYDDLFKMTNEEISEACEEAADIVEGHWCQGNWFLSDEDAPDENYAYCVEGGLAAALGLDIICDAEDTTRSMLMSCPVYDAVLETVNSRSSSSGWTPGHREADAEYLPSYGEGDLPNWNDSDGRTEQEVVDLLRATAKRVLGVA